MVDGKYDSAIEYLNEALKCPDGIGNHFILLRLGESFYESHRLKNKSDDLIFQSAICAEASQICPYRRAEFDILLAFLSVNASEWMIRLNAREYLIQAYMCEGAEIFEGEDKKYRKLIDDFI